MLPPCIPFRRFSSRDNRPGLAHFIQFYTFHCLPVLSQTGWFEYLSLSISKACRAHSIAIWGYALLPNHVRLLVKPALETYCLKQFVACVKTDFQQTMLDAASLPELKSLRVREKDGTRSYHFWQQGTGPVEAVASAATAHQKRDCCHGAAVELDLANIPEDWPWSSWHWTHGRRQLDPLPMQNWMESWKLDAAPRRAAMMY